MPRAAAPRLRSPWRALPAVGPPPCPQRGHACRRHARRSRAGPGEAGTAGMRPRGTSRAGRRHPHDAARGPDRPRHLPGGRGHPRGLAGRLPHHRPRRGPGVRAAARRDDAGASVDFGTTAARAVRGRVARPAGWTARSPTTPRDVRPAEDPQRAAASSSRTSTRPRAATPAPSATADDVEATGRRARRRREPRGGRRPRHRRLSPAAASPAHRGRDHPAAGRVGACRDRLSTL